MPLLNDTSLFVSTAKGNQNFCLVGFCFCLRNSFSVEGAGNYSVDVSISINLAWRVFQSMVRSLTAVFDKEVEAFDEGSDNVVRSFDFDA